MIIQCQSCAAKYFLPEEKIPVNPLKVRCPKCRAVFMLAGRREPVAVAPAVTIPAQAEAAPVAAAVMSSPMIETLRDTIAPAPEIAPAPAPAPEIIEEPVASAPAIEAAMPEPAAPPAPAPAAEPARPSRGTKSADDRAKRLARVLVSDILWYNRERRDAALRDGTLMTSLGEEIKKSWELYKDKVGPEAAHSTNYFKEALNEILADGQQVF
jgi:predicted Zn finger-like uncharacterized protein